MNSVIALPDDDGAYFQLAQLLRLCKEREGTAAELSRQITRAALRAGMSPARVKAFHVSRRKIDKIIDCTDDFTLNLPQLRAIHCYLSTHGCGLDIQTLFVNPNLLRSLASSGDVAFLLGSKPDFGEAPDACRVNHSHLDVAAMTEILRGIALHRSDLRVDFRDVLLQNTLQDARTQLLQDDWVALLEDDGPSIVTIGLPRSNPGTELVLSRMFEVEPFQRPTAPLPFYVVFSRSIAGPVPSLLTLYGEDIAALDAAHARAIEVDGTRGVVFGNRSWLAEPPRCKDSRSWGFVVAQRKRSGRIHLAVFGLNSVATFGAALAADSILGSLRDPQGGRHGPVLWVPIEVHLQLDRPLPAWAVKREIRISVGERGPRYWTAKPSGPADAAAAAGA